MPFVTITATPTATPVTTGTAATDVVWRVWSTTSASTWPAVPITSDVTWAGWCTASATTTACTAGNIVWAIWAADSSSSTRSHVAPASFTESPELVAARDAERARQAEERRRLDEAARQERVRAAERATQLLLSVLDESQRRDLSEHGHFYVTAPASGRLYRIDKGRSGNIKVIDRVTRTWVESLCVHQQEMVPEADTMLMQKLLIESAEDELRAVANITRKDGSASYGRGRLDGDRLAQVIPFPSRVGVQEGRRAA